MPGDPFPSPSTLSATVRREHQRPTARGQQPWTAASRAKQVRTQGTRPKSGTTSTQGVSTELCKNHLQSQNHRAYVLPYPLLGKPTRPTHGVYCYCYTPCHLPRSPETSPTRTPPPQHPAGDSSRHFQPGRSARVLAVPVGLLFRRSCFRMHPLRHRHLQTNRFRFGGL